MFFWFSQQMSTVLYGTNLLALKMDTNCVSCEVGTNGKKVSRTLVQALRLCTGRTAHRRRRGTALPFHDHGTRRSEGSASRPGRSLPLERPGTHCTGGWMDRSGQVRKIAPPPGFDLRTVQPVASRYTDYATRPTK
jgi:hypothetical protein